MIDQSIFKNEERAVYTLRSLYSRFGYRSYKMSKFEEYDFYAKNKDFLISDGILTFTDKAGKLLALKPDVTLSIVKNSKDDTDTIEKFYYNENVYRVTQGTHNFKEIMQTGLECIGDVDLYATAEVLMLAVKSLVLLHEECVLDLSHAGLVCALLEQMTDLPSVKDELSEAIVRKSADVARALVLSGKISEKNAALAILLMNEYDSADAMKEALAPKITSEDAKGAFGEFYEILKTLESLDLGKYLNISFYLPTGSGYYSGVVFQGYIKGIPDRVLSGGRYDGLMKKLGKRAGAIGFAVYLDSLERFGEDRKEYDVDVLLLREKDADTAKVVSAISELSGDGSTVSVQTAIPTDIRYRRLVHLGKNGWEEA